MTAGTDTAHRPAAWSLPFLVLARVGVVLVRVWRVCAGMVNAFTVLSWRVLCLGLLALTAVQAVLMLAGGDLWFTSPTYELVRLVPGGMRTWGCALAALWGTTLYGYGRHRAGNGAVLRFCLALIAAWFTLWLLLVAGTFVAAWEVYSAHALTQQAFLAWLAVLVGRAIPPDRT